MYAAWHASPALLQLLLEHGAIPTAQDSKGATARDYLPHNETLAPASRAKMQRMLDAATARPRAASPLTASVGKR
jgi:hypothetical protein